MSLFWLFLVYSFELFLIIVHFYFNRIPSLDGYTNVTPSKYSPTDESSQLLQKTKDVIFVNSANIQNLILATEILEDKVSAMQDDVTKEMSTIESKLKSQLNKLRQKRKRWILIFYGKVCFEHGFVSFFEWTC